MATTTINNPRMSFKYYYMDNSPSRVFHYAEELQESIDDAKKYTNGRSIEICPRYGLSWPVAIVEADGRVIQGMELREIRTRRGQY
jgi:hypothetical protein